MEVNTQAVNFNAKPQLLEFIQRRMNKLEQFYDKVIQTDVYLKVENTKFSLPPVAGGSVIVLSIDIC